MPRKPPDLQPAAAGPARCTAKSKQSGQQCRRWATPGARVCSTHGSKAPQVVEAARRRLLAAEAAADLATFGVMIETTPVEALEAMLYEAAGNVAVLRQLTNSLPLQVAGLIDAGADGDLVYTEGPALAGRLKNDSAAAAPHVWVVMYNAERDRLAKLAEACAKLGLDERRIRLAESQVERLLTAVSASIGDVGLTADQTARFKQALAGRLRGGT